MKGAAALTIVMLVAIDPSQATQHATRPCLIEVLHSEELPIGPMFFHTIKATLLVSAPGMQPFETTVQEVIPWQAPPLRQGKRLHAQCDPTALSSLLRLF